MYDAVVARYSSTATAALDRLIFPYLFPELSAFTIVEDLVTHLRTSDTHYRTALLAEFLDRNPPPMYITLYFIVTRLPDSIRAVRDHFLALDPTDLTVDLLEQHLLAAETSVVTVGAARGTPRTPFFEGCSPSPLAPSYAFAAAVDILGTEDIRTASAPSGKRNSGKGKGVVVVETVEAVEVAEVAVGVVAGVGASVTAVVTEVGVVTVPPSLHSLHLFRSDRLTPRGAEFLPVLPLFSRVQRFRPAHSQVFTSPCSIQTCTALTPLPAPVPVRPADPSGGRVLARSSTLLTCPAVPSGSLSGLHLPLFYTNLVSTAALQDALVITTSPGGPVAPPCSCRLLSHQNLLWHHRLGHPSLPRLRGMHSRLLVSGLPRSLTPLPPSPAPPCLPCVKGRQRTAPYSSSFPPTTALLQTLHMDVSGPVRVSG
ncbi:unnamed protein product [Closterium sp. NIES-53]